MYASSYLYYYRVLANYNHEFDLYQGRIPDESLLTDSIVGKYPDDVRDLHVL